MPSIGRKGPRKENRQPALGPATDRLDGSRAIILPRPLRKPMRRAVRWITSGEALSIRTIAVLTTCAALLGSGTLIAGQGGIVSVMSRATLAAGIRIGDIQVAGNREVTEIDVLSVLDLGTGRSLFTFDVHKARHDLKALPWVAEATVAKAYPDTLKVRLTERTPFAVWQRGEELWLISRDGEQIIPFDDRFAGLPLVVGPGANEHAAEMLALIARYPELAEQAAAYVRVGRRRWNIALKNGFNIMLPEANVQKAVAKYLGLEAERDLMARDVAHVDLRLEGRVVLGLTETGTAQMEEFRKERAMQAKQGGRT